jgi:mRNA interferase RelE/StbE
MYRVEIASRRVERQLRRLPPNVYPKIKEAILNLSKEPRPRKSVKLEDNIYRIRIGHYRIIYVVEDNNKLVVVTKVAKRGESTYK